MDEKRAGLGYQDFEEVRTEHIFYIDKTDFIREWWENADKVTLITRPRRFGKTLNMSTVECFFSNKYAGRSDLFEGLSIWKEEKYRKLQGTFPVIKLSFANVKAVNCQGMKYQVTEVISDLYAQNRYLLEGDLLSHNEREYFEYVKCGMDDTAAAGAVHRMSDFMQRYYGKKVIVILDEYDTPMQEAWLSGYWEEAVGFFRSFFNSTFKTNPFLYRGLITGITRISKQSIFSDLNNLKVASTTSSQYAVSFGFTDKEVFAALDAAGLGQEKQEVKRWYNGFTFGGHTDIYNPWSIASFIGNNCEYDTYWADTSSNGLISSLIQGGSSDLKEIMEELLQGKSFEANLDEQIVFSQLNGNTNAVWSLLLATGYLKVLNLARIGVHKEKVYTLALTNMEVECMFDHMVKGWFGGAAETHYNNFVKALLVNDVDAMNEFINKIALQSFSSFDTAKGASEEDAPERFYHGFVLGLMVELAGRFQITSNRESGFGRYDVMLSPADREKDHAYIIEFKVHKYGKEKNLEETVENAKRQIEERHYEAELIARGFAPERIQKYGFAFQGKNVLIG